MKKNSKCSNLMPTLLSMLIMVVSFGACLKSNKDDILPQEEEISVTFSVKLPTVFRGLKTYALSDDDETNLQDVDILVYTDDGSGMKFNYRTVGKIINQSSGGGNADIEVKLWRTQVDSRLVVIANARQQLNAYSFSLGEPIENLQANLVYEQGPDERWGARLDDPDDFTPLPMWAEYPVDGGIDGGITIIPGSINLLRSLARVDVLADDADNFVLTAVYVFNSKANGLIIPDPDNLAGSVAHDPSLPSGGPINNSNPLEYIISGDNSLREIYLFEADSHPVNDENATALVVGGRYGTDPDPTYYRIDFRDPDDSGEALPILRNRCYQITITRALNSGYSSEIIAFGEDSVIPIAFSGSGRPSITHEDIVPKGTGGISYTITTTNENE